MSKKKNETEEATIFKHIFDISIGKGRSAPPSLATPILKIMSKTAQHVFRFRLRLMVDAYKAFQNQKSDSHSL